MKPLSILHNRTRLVLLVPMILAVACYIYVFNKKLALNGDNVGYYLLGKSIASGNGYTEIWTEKQTPHRHYPPAYPAFISFVLLLLPDDDFTNPIYLKAANGLFFLGSIVILFLLFKRFSPDKRISFLALLFIAVNAHLLRFAHIMMSEIPFMFFSTATLYTATKITFSKPPHKEGYYYAMIFLLVVSFYIRTQGLALAFGVIFCFGLMKKWRYALSTAFTFAICALPWFCRGQIPKGHSYLEQLMIVDPYSPDTGTVGFIGLLKRLGNNLERYITLEIPSGCFPFLQRISKSSHLLQWLIGVVAIALLVNGVIRMKNHRSLIAGYLIGNFGIILLWPSVWTGTRFMIAVIPLLSFLIILGLFEGFALLSKKLNVPAMALPFLLSFGLLFYLPLLQRMHNDKAKPYPSNWNNYFKAASWIREHTPYNTVTSCRKQGFFYMFSKRPTCRYLFTKDDTRLMEDMIQSSVDFVVIDQLGFGTTPKYLIPAINRNAHSFRKVLHLKNPDTYLFESLFPKDPLNRIKTLGIALNIQALNSFYSGNYQEAERLYKRAIEVIEKKMGKNEIELSKTINNLAVLYFSQKEYAKARSLFRRSMTIEENVQGKDHSDLAVSLNNLGEIYRIEQKYAQAESLFQRALYVRKKAFGEDNEYVVLCLRNFGKLYLNWGKHRKADLFFKQAISTMEKVCGRNHSKMLPLLNEAFRSYRAAGRKDVAAVLAQRIKEIRSTLREMESK